MRALHERDSLPAPWTLCLFPPGGSITATRHGATATRHGATATRHGAALGCLWWSKHQHAACGATDGLPAAPHLQGEVGSGMGTPSGPGSMPWEHAPPPPSPPFIAAAPPTLQSLTRLMSCPAPRHSSAALVCKRWASAVLAPELLEAVAVKLGKWHYEGVHEPATMLARGRALLLWLLKRSAGQQPLKLELTHVVPFNASESLRTELSVLAEGCLAACGPVLDELKLAVEGQHELAGGIPLPPQDVRPWFLGMPQLRSLVLQARDVPMRLLITLGGMGLLQRLTLQVNSLTIGIGVALPPALIRLELEVVHCEGAVSQVSWQAATHTLMNGLSVTCPAALLCRLHPMFFRPDRCRTPVCAASKFALKVPLLWEVLPQLAP